MNSAHLSSLTSVLAIFTREGIFVGSLPFRVWLCVWVLSPSSAALESQSGLSGDCCEFLSLFMCITSRDHSPSPPPPPPSPLPPADQALWGVEIALPKIGAHHQAVPQIPCSLCEGLSCPLSPELWTFTVTILLWLLTFLPPPSPLL